MIVIFQISLTETFCSETAEAFRLETEVTHGLA